MKTSGFLLRSPLVVTGCYSVVIRILFRDLTPQSHVEEDGVILGSYSRDYGSYSCPYGSYSHIYGSYSFFFGYNYYMYLNLFLLFRMLFLFLRILLLIYGSYSFFFGSYSFYTDLIPVDLEKTSSYCRFLFR